MAERQKGVSAREWTGRPDLTTPAGTSLLRTHENSAGRYGRWHIQGNEGKTRLIDLTRGESFGFLGFVFRRVKTRRGKWGVRMTPITKARTALLRKLKETFRRFQSQPVAGVIKLANPILRGWANYFRVGHSSRCFGYVRDWMERKVRRHLMRARKRKGFGWDRWSRSWLYTGLGLYSDYGIRYYQAPKVLPA